MIHINGLWKELRFPFSVKQKAERLRLSLSRLFLLLKSLEHCCFPCLLSSPSIAFFQSNELVKEAEALIVAGGRIVEHIFRVEHRVPE
jgi:hypothetical protein